jgi:hypothetical protein
VSAFCILDDEGCRIFDHRPALPLADDSAGRS